jgi:multidrug efflux pump subunit AcrA (membrane-fusion protein)
MIEESPARPIDEAAALADAMVRADRGAPAFLSDMLAAQCRLAPAEGGALLRIEREGERVRPHLVAAHPPAPEHEAAPEWIGLAAERVGALEGRSAPLVVSASDGSELYGEEPSRHVVLLPLPRSGEERSGSEGAAAYLVHARTRKALEEQIERLRLSLPLLMLFDLRTALAHARGASARVGLATHLASAAMEPRRFHAAAMATCDVAAARLSCERVSIGLLRGRSVRLEAMSHTEKINRKMELVQRLESVMEECLDQDLEVTWPSSADAPTITRAAAEFDRQHGPLALCSVPLRQQGEPIGVLTLERAPERAFQPAEVESLRIAADLTAPRLVELRRRDRWLGARAASEVGGWIGVLLGPEKVWIKVAAILILAAVIFLTFFKGMHRVEAPFSFEATTRQVVPAPFNGYIESVFVEVGDSVEAGETTLATLDTTDLRLQLADARSRRERSLREAKIARRDGEIAQAQIAEAAAAEAEARIDLLEHQIAQASLLPRIDGVVVTGDLNRMIGAPVEIGSVLFEIAPTDALRADLAVPEDQIADVRVGQEGALATASDPGDRIPFVVERINPVAEVRENRNVFIVRARLLETPEAGWLRPGVEGIAKVDVERRAWGWILTRRFVNWVRMQLWI